jgi:acetyl-CoA C-acetyltransferase
MLAAQAIQCGDVDIVVAGGMESMSRAPYMLDRVRFGYRLGHGTLQDAMIYDGLWDHVNDMHMGISNDLCSQKYKVGREDQDRYAVESYRRALAATADGRFQEQIVAVEVPQRKGPSIRFAVDECPREPDYEAFARMKPAFQKEGFATAANSSIISDGAAALVVMAEERARALGIAPMVRVKSQGAAGIDLKYVLVAPILSIPKVAERTGLRPGDIDVHEINEAFSGSTVAVLRELSLDPERVNIYGGAVALGHPIGASGARILTTLIYAMRDRGARTGMATLCLGGGEAVSLLVEAT